jgi:hypothetical protein
VRGGIRLGREIACNVSVLHLRRSKLRLYP